MKKQYIPIIVALLGLVGFGFFILVKMTMSSGFVKSNDQIFGDQNLKTAVALIELHKTRYGHYPQALSELKFTGGWDAVAVQSVTYRAAADGQSYFVDVQRGWIGKPDLAMPAEFWQGTGYDPELKPSSP